MNNLDLNNFIDFALALSALMAGNAFTGAMKARKQGDFNWNTLKDGCFNYFLWLVGTCLTVVGFQLYGGDLQISVGDQVYTLLQAVEIAKKCVYAYWGAKAVENILEYGKIEKKVEAIDPQTKINTDTSVEDGAVG